MICVLHWVTGIVLWEYELYRYQQEVKSDGLNTSSIVTNSLREVTLTNSDNMLKKRPNVIHN